MSARAVVAVNVQSELTTKKARKRLKKRRGGVAAQPPLFQVRRHPLAW